MEVVKLLGCLGFLKLVSVLFHSQEKQITKNNFFLLYIDLSLACVDPFPFRLVWQSVPQNTTVSFQYR